MYAPSRGRHRYGRDALTSVGFSWKTTGLHWTVARIEIEETAGRRAVSRPSIQIHRLSPRKWQENRRYRHRLWYLETWAPTMRKFYYEELSVKEQQQNGEWKHGMEKRGKLRGNDKINIFCYARRRYRLCYVAMCPFSASINGAIRAIRRFTIP